MNIKYIAHEQFKVFALTNLYSFAHMPITKKELYRIGIHTIYFFKLGLAPITKVNNENLYLHNKLHPNYNHLCFFF